MEKVFLGWDTPCLQRSADWLIEKYQTKNHCDLSSLIIVLPGSRAGRRLLELLLERCACLRPPRIVTIGQLPDLLFKPTIPVADDLTSLMVRMQTLQNSPNNMFKHQIQKLAESKDKELLQWFTLAEDLKNLQQELASESITVTDMPKKWEALSLDLQDVNGDSYSDQKRWEVLAQLEQAYLDKLTELGLQDRQHARMQSISQKNCSMTGELILLGTANLNGLTCQMIKQISDQTTALIYAPQSEQAGFDEFGCLVTKYWISRQLPVDASKIHVANRPCDQAMLVIDCLHEISLQQDRTVEDVTLGMIDEKLAPTIKRFLETARLPARLPVSQMLSQSRPVTALNAIVALLVDPQVNLLCDLVRHPDIETYLTKNRGDLLEDNELRKRGIVGFAGIADDYLKKYLDTTLADIGSHGKDHPLEKIVKMVDMLLPEKPNETKPFAVQMQSIRELLKKLYDGVELQLHDHGDYQLSQALSLLNQTLEKIEAANMFLSEIQVDFPQAILCLLQLQKEVTIASQDSGPSIEMLGWLELPFDDAPVLIITGVNDQYLPQSTGADAFLPHMLRDRLGLLNNDQRFVRDLFNMTAIVHSHNEQVHFIFGRIDNQGNPLTPSRILLCETPEKLPHRVIDFYKKVKTYEAVYLVKPKAKSSQFLIPKVKKIAKPINHLSVTAFKDYIASPFRFYLKHILKLKTIAEDDMLEMNGGLFGTLVHHALSDFGKNEISKSAKVDEIYDYLTHRLKVLIKKEFGQSPTEAVLLQAEMIHYRFLAFAQKQAGFIKNGWRVDTKMIEQKYSLNLEVDGENFEIVGVIDRVDWHDTAGCRVIDYKTSEAGKKPEITHRFGPKNNKQWKDFQLPLYREMLRKEIGIDKIELGYFVLSKKYKEIGFEKIAWSNEEFDQAIDGVKNIIQKIRKGEFWEMGTAPTYDDGFKGICLERCFGKDQILVESWAEHLENTKKGEEHVASK